ncbi:efflux RND transporter periplasmic adaptor subunit [Novosphingobium sp. YJ-S2-02]|uniref:Efflux RND transporter periplasmic adaptor subunit n=1 Tax=Novosphingobium aureum TaxID=2792964 RepID=A0A931MMH3_9SPHN|nr:efflux RND transporter periplasmic adaptor subunit [Novosphingobium aureum]MBH0114415.1 efflux RND transporter periplasmic adaptor subunit [Novosphingobium aureum]
MSEWHQEPKGRTRTILVTVLVLVVLMAAIYGWRMMRMSGAQGWPQQATPVAATVLGARRVADTRALVGSLSAVREVTLAPETSGRVSGLHFRAGQDVRAGALLVQLYDAPEKADLAAARARADFARLQLERSQELAPSGAEPREVLQQRRAEHAQALAAVAQIEARLRQKQVRAPFAGRLGIRQVDPGQYMNPGDAVATLTALDRLYVDFAIPQQELSRLRPGDSVTLTSDAWPERTFTARLETIEPQVSRETRNVTAQAVIANPDGALRPGMYVKVALELGVDPEALVLPVTAIQTSAQGDSVIVIRGTNPRKGGKAEIVPVTTGQRMGDDVVVTGKLSPGDVVVAQGQLRVQPGSEVTVSQLVGGETAKAAKPDGTEAGAR